MVSPLKNRSPQDIRRSLQIAVSLLAFLVFYPTPASAATRFIIDGYLTPSDTEGVAFSLSQSPLERSQQDLSDPDSKVDGPLPRRVRIVVDIDPSAPATSVPIVDISSSPGLFPSMKPNPTRPGLWAGSDNGLYPSLDEPISNDRFKVSGISVAPLDTDNDGTPDSEDTDDDGDDVPDLEDAFPLDPSESLDTDGDLIGNNADPDDDDDGMPDTFETKYGLDPLKNDAKRDLDRDGFLNYDEYRAGTSPKDPRSHFLVHIEPLTFFSKYITFSWKGVKGTRYDLEGSKKGGKYFKIESNLTVQISGEIIKVNIKRSNINNYTFYRVRVY